MNEAEPPLEETQEPAAAPAAKARPTALWLLALLVAAQLAAITIPGWIAPGTPIHFYGLMFGAMGCSALIVLWWFTRTKITLRDRAVGFLLFAAALVGFAGFLFHPYMVPMPTIMYVLPSVFLALLVLLTVSQPIGWGVGRFVTLAGIVAVLAGWCAVRSKGVDGNLAAGFEPRWKPTAEAEFLAQVEAAVAGDQRESVSLEANAGDWTGFRGPNRDGRLVGQTIAADWNTAPPVERWRRKVGPGWGSFTLVGGLLFTQEQRGEQEVVACYEVATGEPRWTNEVAARFEESAAGPGPRATPTFHGGRLYTTGANGAVQCLDAATGEPIWRRSLVDDTSAELMLGNWWGFASSPLVVDLEEGRSLAIVVACTPHPREPDAPNPNDTVIAYDAATGEPEWVGGVGNHAYSSPHYAEFDGAPQVLVATNAGLESLVPATGERLWLYEWSSSEYPRVVQPTLLPGGRVVLGTGYGFGTHLLSVTREGDSWSTKTEWQTKKLKPYFNDLVHYQGHLYGFDGKFFTCLDAETGEVTWPRSVKRKAAFGHGQALLVEDSGLIVLVTEDEGDLVLVEANPETLVVRGRLKALADKTWNHPVIHGGRLYVRNSVEMACFELPTGGAELATAR